MPTKNSTREVVSKILNDAPFSLRQLAEEADLSYDSLRSWATGRRRPRQKKREALAAVLRRRGALLLDLADKLEAAPSE